MRLSIILLALLLTVALVPWNASAQTGWTVQISTTSSDFTSVSFPAPDTAFVVGYSGALLRTCNSGQTWVMQTSPVSPDNLYGVSFSDGMNGVAAGVNGDIIYTSNAGILWNTAQTGWMISYYDACQASPMVGYTAGVNTIFQPLAARTRNGWLNFDHTAFYVIQGGVSNEGNIRGLCFVNDSTGYAAVRVWNGQGAIAKTTDYGATWTTVYWHSNAFNSVDFPTPNIGYAVGFQGAIVKTENAGATWTAQTSGVNIILNDVSFPEPGIGFAVGEGGVILRTANGGTNWEVLPSPVLANLNSVDFRTRNIGFVVGVGGTILYTASGGAPAGISLELIPVNPPIVVPQGGGWISFIARVANNAGYMIEFDAWTHATLPSGAQFGPLMVRTNIRLAENTTIERTLRQYVPANAPAGNYWLNGYLGDYPTREVWACDSVPFTKSAADYSGSSQWLASGWEDDEPSILNAQSIVLNSSPNPFNASTVISYKLQAASNIKLSIYDIAGREVAVLADGYQPSGQYQVSFTGADLASGMYLARMKINGAAQTMKLLLVK